MMLEQVLLKILEKKIGCKEGQLHLIKKNYTNQYFTCETELGKFFVKTRSQEHEAVFAAEARALEEIDYLDTVRVPVPHFYGTAEGNSFLIVEFIDLYPHTAESMKKLGKGIALMHLKGKEKRFGFPLDNRLGESPQLNPWVEEWSEFFKNYRIGVQLNLLKKKYNDVEIEEKGEKFLPKIEEFFTDIKIQPSLLHGDLWYGNTAVDDEGTPVIFDPASYYGHDEAELSIASLFGHFQTEFFEAYHELIPKQEGFDERQELYKFYHLLNHYNIFGTSYREDCLLSLNKLLKL